MNNDKNTNLNLNLNKKLSEPYQSMFNSFSGKSEFFSKTLIGKKIMEKYKTKNNSDAKVCNTSSLRNIIFNRNKENDSTEKE